MPMTKQSGIMVCMKFFEMRGELATSVNRDKTRFKLVNLSLALLQLGLKSSLWG